MDSSHGLVGEGEWIQLLSSTFQIAVQKCEGFFVYFLKAWLYICVFYIRSVHWSWRRP